VYLLDENCISEHSRILVKEKEDSFFVYKSVKKILKLLEQKKELYSFNFYTPLNKILGIEFIGLQPLWHVQSFSGSQIFLGIEAEIFVDGEWIKVSELRHHEKIYEYDIVRELYHETFILNFQESKKSRGYRVIFEDPNGICVNNYFLRFPDRIEEKEPVTTKKEQKS